MPQCFIQNTFFITFLFVNMHIFTDSRRFQNAARRFAKFPRTRAAPPFVVIVVEKECCTQILATVNR